MTPAETRAEALRVNRDNMETMAYDLQARIARGEKIPLSELSEYIRFVNTDCKEIKAARNVKEKTGKEPPAEDVDFF